MRRDATTGHGEVRARSFKNSVLRPCEPGGDLQDELEPIIEDLRADLDDTMSKSQTANVIGVSLPTLDKWIERIVSVKGATSGLAGSRHPPLRSSGQRCLRGSSVQWSAAAPAGGFDDVDHAQAVGSALRQKHVAAEQ
jgi:hypothetical protein